MDLYVSSHVHVKNQSSHATKAVVNYLEEIVPPVLACFSDQDARVRYYACESMYNIAKVAKGEILVYFNEVFDALTKVRAVQRPNGGGTLAKSRHSLQQIPSSP